MFVDASAMCAILLAEADSDADAFVQKLARGSHATTSAIATEESARKPAANIKVAVRTEAIERWSNCLFMSVGVDGRCALYSDALGNVTGSPL